MLLIVPTCHYLNVNPAVGNVMSVDILFLLQKVSRKLRLSKTKNTKFNDSGILLPFYFFFAAWGADIILKVKQYICVHYEKYLYA